MLETQYTTTRSATAATTLRVARPTAPIESAESRACGDCGARFVPGDLPLEAYGIERGAYGPIYLCPTCHDACQETLW